MIEHVTARVTQAGWSIAGCTCGWTGPRRSLAVAGLVDERVHRRESLADVVRCDEPECPVCASLR